MKIAFYAPMKPPDAPLPSGDRLIARLLMRALATAGHEVDLISTFRVWDGRGDAETQARLFDAAEKERTRILAGTPSPPDLVFTYHCHYRAPDLLGPDLAEAWDRPYAIAEGSYSPKRADGPWAAFHEASATALRRADLHLVLSPRDRAGIDAIGRDDAVIRDLPPFLDDAPYRAIAPPPAPPPVRLLTVAMMRPGEKAWSYRFLIDALAILDTQTDLPAWTWTVIGDGPARADIQARAEARLSRPAEWRGGGTPDDIRAALAQAHLFLWPGLGEGIGMVYLEAMAAGRPVLAVDGPGVVAVLEPPEGGWLTPRDPGAYAQRLAALVRNDTLRTTLGAAGRARIAARHGLDTTARRLDMILTLVMKDR